MTSQWKLQIFVLITVTALWPTTRHKAAPTCLQHSKLIRKPKYYLIHILKNLIYYSQDFLNSSKFTILLDLNACASKTIVSFSFAFRIVHSGSFIYVLVQYTLQWTILREMIVVLSYNQNSKSGTTIVITPALPPLCFSPASKHTSQDTVLSSSLGRCVSRYGRTNL